MFMIVITKTTWRRRRRRRKRMDLKFCNDGRWVVPKFFFFPSPLLLGERKERGVIGVGRERGGKGGEKKGVNGAKI